jgi:hypothetical protein
MVKKLVNNSGTKYLSMDKEIFENIEEVEIELVDKVNKKIIISWK